MLDGQRFGDDGTSTAGSEQAGDRHNQMDEKKRQVARNPDRLSSKQRFASLGFCLDLSYELRIRHQQVIAFGLFVRTGANSFYQGIAFRISNRENMLWPKGRDFPETPTRWTLRT